MINRRSDLELWTEIDRLEEPNFITRMAENLKTIGHFIKFHVQYEPRPYIDDHNSGEKFQISIDPEVHRD